jgi:hypothetical protein
MNNGEGMFERIDETTAKEMESFLSNHDKYKTLKGSGIFKIGEVLEIKGNEFVIRNITRHGLSLKLLPDTSRALAVEEFKKEESNGN